LPGLIEKLRFFEHIDHNPLLAMLANWIDDQPLGLIRKWLKAGIMETDGQIVHPAMGTPQGGTVSPILANVYGRLFGRKGNVLRMTNDTPSWWEFVS
jgi:retron-type reverse transcriptase